MPIHSKTKRADQERKIKHKTNRLSNTAEINHDGRESYTIKKSMKLKVGYIIASKTYNFSLSGYVIKS